MNIITVSIMMTLVGVTLATGMVARKKDGGKPTIQKLSSGADLDTEVYKSLGHQEHVVRKLHTRSLAHPLHLNRKANGVGTLRFGGETRAGMATPLLKFIARLMKKAAPKLGEIILRLFKPFLPVGNRLKKMGVLSKVEKFLTKPKGIIKSTGVYKGTLKDTIKNNVKSPLFNSIRRSEDALSNRAILMAKLRKKSIRLTIKKKFRNTIVKHRVNIPKIPGRAPTISIKKKIANTVAKTSTMIRNEAKVPKISGKTATKLADNLHKMAGKTATNTGIRIKPHVVKKYGNMGIFAPMNFNNGMWGSAEGKMFRTIRRISGRKIVQEITGEHKIAKIQSAGKVLEKVSEENKIGGKGVIAERTVPKSTVNIMEKTEEKLKAKPMKKTLTRASDSVKPISADKSTSNTAEKITKSSSSLKTNSEKKPSTKIDKNKNKKLSEPPKRPSFFSRAVEYMFPKPREEDVFKGPYEPPVARGSWIWDILDTIGVFDYIFGYVDED